MNNFDAIFIGTSVLVEEAHSNAKNKGFWDKERNDAEMIALMHSELSEALEAIREDKPRGDVKDNLVAEFADVIIRIADFCGGRNINLAQALVEKIKYNRARGYLHGKKF